MPFGQESKAASKKPQAIKILHVEDNPTLAGLVQEIADNESWEIEHCIDGDTALEQLVGPTQYDLLLVDFQLPGLNGMELVEQVRTMSHRRDIPIVMMSGTLSEAAARTAGANAFLRKPQDIGSLAETIVRLLESGDRAS